MCRRRRIRRMGAMPTSPLVRAAGFAVLEEAAPLPADLTLNNEQEWTSGS
jgi:hypothetical protein